MGNAMNCWVRLTETGPSEAKFKTNVFLHLLSVLNVSCRQSSVGVKKTGRQCGGSSYRLTVTRDCYFTRCQSSRQGQKPFNPFCGLGRLSQSLHVVVDGIFFKPRESHQIVKGESEMASPPTSCWNKNFLMVLSGSEHLDDALKTNLAPRRGWRLSVHSRERPFGSSQVLLKSASYNAFVAELTKFHPS